uniref:Uncharacterized protein n=1 Tax=Anopheles culicifacies TaxID=139723 RepID=A0A182M6N0_9DIPT
MTRHQAEHQISPTTRRTKSFDDQAWKVHDETVNLSANISAISTTALAIRSPAVDYDLESLGSSREPRSRSSGLNEVLVAAGTDELHTSDAHTCSTLNRGEVRKSRSKMKSYLKRCKDVLISGVVGHTGGAGSCPNTGTPEDHQDVVVYHAQSDESQPNSASCWYLDDHLMELRPEDNREPYSSLASARLKLEMEESRMARESTADVERRLDEVPAVGAEVPTANVTTIVTNTSSSSMARIGSTSEQLHRPSTEESTSNDDVISEDSEVVPKSKWRRRSNRTGSYQSNREALQREPPPLRRASTPSTNFPVHRTGGKMYGEQKIERDRADNPISARLSRLV